MGITSTYLLLRRKWENKYLSPVEEKMGKQSTYLLSRRKWELPVPISC
jgi:hypothetical protein